MRKGLTHGPSDTCNPLSWRTGLNVRMNIQRLDCSIIELKNNFISDRHSNLL
jgi:hypothetical protein